MKSEREIRNKIDEYMEKLNQVKHDNTADSNKEEEICCIIDALLWVIGDESGKAI